ncbi:TauD/TfdA family dioxygenase [Legionella sp.]|uniref:TauD/TfdA family dioxygenase n=1 Tax=Legionella sp. TaxID=459 RepID=UPI003CBE6145
MSQDLAYEEYISINYIKNMLKKSGYVHVSTNSTLEDFYELANILGEIINKSDINILLSSDRLYKQPQKIDFHTDGPDADIVGWFCVKQDAYQGHSALLDSRQILKHFSCEELTLLGTIMVTYPIGNSVNKEVPLIQKTIAGHYALCYLPWSDPDFNLSPSQKAIYSAFKYAVSEEASKQLIRIRLHKNEMLLIDNKRILHGRAKIEKNSLRMLKRVWINCGNYETETNLDILSL